MSGDAVTAALEESRALGREYVAAPGPLGQLGREVLLLRDALETVLGNHAKLPGGPSGDGYCPTCWRIWPCETYRAMSAALTGEPAPALRDAQGGQS